jgi:hypothetical protein
MPLGERRSRGGNQRTNGREFIGAEQAIKPRRTSGPAGQTGLQGKVDCPVCGTRVAQVLAPYSIPEFGYKQGKTRLIPNHTPKGETYRAGKGDMICRASMLSFEDAQLVR